MWSIVHRIYVYYKCYVHEITFGFNVYCVYLAQVFVNYLTTSFDFSSFDTSM